MIINPAPSEAPADDYPKPTLAVAPMPLWWRAALLGGVAVFGGLAYFTQPYFGSRGQAGFGLLCFLGVAAAFSQNLRAVSLRTFASGVVLQLLVAVAVLYSPQVQEGFRQIGNGITVLIDCSNEGADFVFGGLASPRGPIDSEVGAAAGAWAMPSVQHANTGARPFYFAFRALPPIIFVSAFFSVLYYFGILQFIVRVFSAVMQYVMGTSGAETLSVSANVFMGQTEAPLIVKPFVPRMTQSELLTLMASGMAHISGGMMAVYISYGADPVSILCTCVMACPCSLYLSKLILPELAKPDTLGESPVSVKSDAQNPIDAASRGIKDGMFLAANVAAMLIGFIAFIALLDAIIGAFHDGLSLKKLFGWGFSPVAYLMGVDANECQKVGELLGTKLAANEHVAYLDLKEMKAAKTISPEAHRLAVFALSGFANFASIGIQLGGIGAMAPGRRADLARLGLKALFVGFLVTLINASVAGLLT